MSAAIAQKARHDRPAPRDGPAAQRRRPRGAAARRARAARALRQPDPVLPANELENRLFGRRKVLVVAQQGRRRLPSSRVPPPWGLGPRLPGFRSLFRLARSRAPVRGPRLEEPLAELPRATPLPASQPSPRPKPRHWPPWPQLPGWPRPAAMQRPQKWSTETPSPLRPVPRHPTTQRHPVRVTMPRRMSPLPCAARGRFPRAVSRRLRPLRTWSWRPPPRRGPIQHRSTSRPGMLCLHRSPSGRRDRLRTSCGKAWKQAPPRVEAARPSAACRVLRRRPAPVTPLSPRLEHGRVF
jgi:hypothetical protein